MRREGWKRVGKHKCEVTKSMCVYLGRGKSEKGWLNVEKLGNRKNQCV